MGSSGRWNALDPLCSWPRVRILSGRLAKYSGCRGVDEDFAIAVIVAGVYVIVAIHFGR